MTQDVVAALKDRHAKWQQEDAARKTGAGAAEPAKSAAPPPPNKQIKTGVKIILNVHHTYMYPVVPVHVPVPG